MPSIFKLLATITVWILFVYGCIGVIFVCGGLAHSVGGTPLIIGAWIASILSLISAVIAIKIRKMLEQIKLIIIILCLSLHVRCSDKPLIQDYSGYHIEITIKCNADINNLPFRGFQSNISTAYYKCPFQSKYTVRPTLFNAVRTLSNIPGHSYMEMDSSGALVSCRTLVV